MFGVKLAGSTKYKLFIDMGKKNLFSQNADGHKNGKKKKLGSKNLE